MNLALPRPPPPPLRSGVALAITLAVVYSVCAVVWVLAPGSFLSFMNNLFHGMNFTNMVQPGPFDWAGFVTSLFIQSTTALFAGAFFAGLLNRLTH